MEVVGDGLTPEDFASLRRQSNWLLGLDYDLAGFYATVKEDPVLDGLVCRLHGLKPTREPSIFQSLVTTVIGQQISSHVAYSMLRELVQSYGEPFAWEEHIYYRFPTPEGLASRGIEGLRRHKLSQRKSEYIYGIALAVAEGTLDLEGLRQMGNEGVIRELTQLRGVGTWTAQWILCNPLGRFDVFPAGDLALLRMLSRLYLDGRAVTPEEAEAFSERWGPYRVPVITYLYAALRLGIDVAK
jgi:DNA-3-methyladenine glycosylase II